MNPAPTLLSEWITPTGFAVIVLLLLLLAIGVVIAENLTGQWTRAGRMIDAAPGPDDDRLARDVARYHCQGHGCRLEVTSHDSRGTRYTCTVCEQVTWVPAASVYDQDLDGTDLAKWEKEMPA